MPISDEPPGRTDQAVPTNAPEPDPPAAQRPNTGDPGGAVAEQSADQGAVDQVRPAADRPARPETGVVQPWPAPERPPRPTRTSYLRSPLDDLAVPAPRSVRLSLWAWIASCIPAALAIILTLSRMTEVRAHLRATALTDTPDLTAASLVRIVNVTIWIALAALAVPIIIQVVLAVVMASGGSWARFVLPVLGLLALPAAVIAFDALSDETAVTNHSNMIIGISLQAALMVAAVVLMFVPASRQWFRSRRRGRR